MEFETDHLPVMPDVARQIFDTFTDEWITVPQLCEIVNQDPAISARLLGVANSAYFAAVGPVETLETAVSQVLGLELARGIAVGMTCSSMAQFDQCAHFDANRFWVSAITVSQAAMKVSPAASEPKAALFGLLWNIGLLAYAATYPQQCDELLTAEEGASLAKRFHATTGESINGVGRQLCEAWELPDFIVDAHRDLERLDKFQLSALEDVAVPQNELAASVWLVRASYRYGSDKVLQTAKARHALSAFMSEEQFAEMDLQAMRQDYQHSLRMTH